MTKRNHPLPSRKTERNHMNRIGYRYRFAGNVDLREAKKTLVLAMLATEGLFGPDRVRKDAAWACDESINVIVIDAGTLVGRMLCLIFSAFIANEFGSAAFDVREVSILSSFYTQADC